MQTIATTPIRDVITAQRQFFATGKTKDIAFRLTQLHNLYQAIKNREDAIYAALKADLNKPNVEAYYEIVVTRDIKAAIKNLKSWTKPQKLPIPLEQFPAQALRVPEPLGVVLIVGAWNYPFNLIIAPLIGAIAAGNCAVIKPSELSPHTSRLIAEIIGETFPPHYITVVEGGIDMSQQLLAEKFDYIFFTGSPRVGKIVMEAAAKHLTPVTLELGGKSPCIVTEDVNIEVAAKRIVWGKFVNAGQTCIAPDYLLVQQGVKAQLLAAIKAAIIEFYGNEPANSPDYGRIINHSHWQRLTGLLDGGEIIVGGQINPDERYLSPTVMDNVSLEAAVMQEEIFGPILPVMGYGELSEAIDQINRLPKPLALYIFSHNPNHQEQILQQTSSGTVCINDTLVHFITSNLPFGGVGNSGMGSCHGKASFDTFSHYKSILKRSFLFDVDLRYPPYRDKLSWLKRLLGG
ncbi:MAG TPA: aldehyde dehydrogenase [Oscillatoriaceae cyanobacterium M33_DOE_052]|uniref:Aldehyde dehydrogenase n=1 Tax=Planktothricoides sp. SpSt-374 TaxID=2282167 RepID=A0A7C3VSM5_9CYAN|nr:aldehyde dehydrogenase [Oscillatoriaceae cyanobacterium M33_DOE_052]